MPRRLSLFGLPSFARSAGICLYLILVLVLSIPKGYIADSRVYQQLGVRFAWSCYAQLPLCVLLASKSSLIGFVLGTSYERLSWIHRSVSSIFIATSTLHAVFYTIEYTRSHLLGFEWQHRDQFRYGAYSFGVLLWIFLSSVGALRERFYRAFLIQHFVGLFAFFWFLWYHVPQSRRFFWWFAVTAIIWDRLFAVIRLTIRNIFISRQKGSMVHFAAGFDAQLQASGDDITLVKLTSPKVFWKSGQHILLYAPHISLLGWHPFTIASSSDCEKTGEIPEMQLSIKKYSGFSKKIHDYARSHNTNEGSTVTMFVDGPYGNLGRWSNFDSVILIATSTGTSFTLPILESIVDSEGLSKPSVIRFLVISKTYRQVDFYIKRTSKAVQQAYELGIDSTAQIAITGTSFVEDFRVDEESQQYFSPDDDLQSLVSADDDDDDDESTPTDSKEEYPVTSNSIVSYTKERPNISEYLLDALRKSEGRTAVVVCGGESVVSATQNAVARSLLTDAWWKPVDFFAENFSM